MTSEGGSFLVLVTANAFMDSGEEVARPLVEAGASIVHAPQAGPLTEEELRRDLVGCDAVIASSDAYTRAVLEASPRLKLIARWGVGVDSIDLEAATAQGVAVVNTPGMNTEAVADYTLAMMLAQARLICPARDLMVAGGWGEFRGVDVWRKCLGIVGFGAIGRAVARRAAGFSMRLLARDPGLKPEIIQAGGARPVAMSQLLEEADFVTLHAALTPETAGMIGEAELRSMKPSAVLINAGRGRLVDEAALLRALEEGWIAGAALDVYTEEPLPGAHPLRHAPNCLALPHNAFNTEETAVAINQAIVKNVLAVMRGERPPNLVNLDLAR